MSFTLRLLGEGRVPRVSPPSLATPVDGRVRNVEHPAARTRVLMNRRAMRLRFAAPTRYVLN
eukprot:10947988-Lingulodinium_polyedra.AAC.1